MRMDWMCCTGENLKKKIRKTVFAEKNAGGIPGLSLYKKFHCFEENLQLLKKKLCQKELFLLSVINITRTIEKPNLTSSQPSNSNPPLTLSLAPPAPPQSSMAIPNKQVFVPPPTPTIPAKKNQPAPLQSSMAIPIKQGPVPPPPHTIPAKKNQPAPLQSSMAIPNKQGPVPPPPPAIPAKKNQPPPPPPPKVPSSNFPPMHIGNPSKGGSGESSTGQSSTAAAAAGNGHVKLKPLHWDKVNKNAGQSMVWDKIDGGSFRVDDDLMEALFGFVATNRKSPKRDSNSSNSNNLLSSSPAQIVILDARKSQNMAIVLKSLAVSRNELLDALTNGQGLSVDALEKLMRIAPTKEEESPNPCIPGRYY
uniref:FH2 domain-containing protein n=1 Tax=Salix viminalis TaxID=40686 RepID=A0A6N2N3E5_SALVM